MIGWKDDSASYFHLVHWFVWLTDLDAVAVILLDFDSIVASEARRS